MSAQQIPGLQYPSWLNESDPQHAAMKNVYDNLFYLRGAIANIPSGSLTPQQIQQIQQLVSETINNINNQITNNFTAAPFIVTTHAIRLTTTPTLGAALYEYDRNSFYVGSNSTGVILWTWDGGNMVDALVNQPADLVATDKGFIFTSNDTAQETQYVWDGTQFVTVGGYLQSIKDTVTNLISTVMIWAHTTSGTPVKGFGIGKVTRMHDTTNILQTVAYETDEWSSNATTATLKSWYIYIASVITKTLQLSSAGLSLILGGFQGIFTHANSADRTYIFADANGNIVYETAALTNGNFVLGAGGAKAVDAGFAVVPIASGGTSAITAAAARTALGAAAAQAPAGAPATITLAKITGGGANGSLTITAEGTISAFVAPT